MNKFLAGVAFISGLLFVMFLWASSSADVVTYGTTSTYDPEATPYILVSGLICAVCIGTLGFRLNKQGRSE